MRPANIITAIADILAGVAISGFFSGAESYFDVLLLMLSTSGLYGGGVVFNDVFDAELDKVERPERPIPSGVVSKEEAAMLGGLLFVTGIASAFAVSIISGTLATSIAVFALVYDRWGKHHDLLGPVNMGMCRGLNLLLGISVNAERLDEYWVLAIVPVVYIAAITMISRGEVHGGSKRTLYFAFLLYCVVITSIGASAVINGNMLLVVLFLTAFAVMIFPPLFRAIKDSQGPLIGKAVKAGVLALILMNAAWAAAFGLPIVAITIAVLLPLSLMLARLFAVT